MLTLHLVPNAHLDPVWLWDQREGLNQGIRTVRAVLDLMDEFPELTFMRGEAAIYRHIEEFDPDAFGRIVAYVREGRWDVIGGTVVQPDSNLSCAENWVRQFTRGLTYFRERVGVRPTAAWQADSFGHPAGLPDILAAAGMADFSFTRPFPGTVPTAKPAFWWEGTSGARILCYRPEEGWYGANRWEVKPRLDAMLKRLAGSDLENHPAYIGLGDHGGGPSRRQVLDVREWAAAHPEVKVVWGGLHSYFAALRKEIAAKGGDGFLPVHRGELNYTLRGCYTSAARYKFAYRKAESELNAAERADTIVASALGLPPRPQAANWDALLFGAFHDILPGTSHERAMAEQLQQVHGVLHDARMLSQRALNELSRAVDTSVPRPVGDMPQVLPFVAFNPHPWTYRGPIELEGCMDDRPDFFQGEGEIPLEVRDPRGRRVAFQSLHTEPHTGEGNWRARALVEATIPPFGWAVYTFGWVAKTARPAASTTLATNGKDRISGGRFAISARVGAEGVRILRDGKPFLRGKGLQAVTTSDPQGSWGGDQPDQADLAKMLERWTVRRVEVVDKGPLRVSLLIRLAGATSWIDLVLALTDGRDAVDVDARVLWNERATRLKLVMDVGAAQADYAVPAATVRRPASAGLVPGFHAVALDAKANALLGFASDALYGFDLYRGALCASVVRGSGYASGCNKDRPLPMYRGATDQGELRFRFVLAPGDAPLGRLAAELEMPPQIEIAPFSTKGELGRSGSLFGVAPASLRVMAVKPAEDGNGVVLRVQETAGRAARASVVWNGRSVALGSVGAKAIATWRLVGQDGKAEPRALAVDASERIFVPAALLQA